jgi:ASC-1-like (ASCH) protein
MKLDAQAFDRLAGGDKTLELRLYDDKRRLLRVGDEITFTNNGREVVTEINGLLIYATFKRLITDVPAQWLGYEEADKPYLKSSMYEIYTPEQEATYGVLGIRM